MTLALLSPAERAVLEYAAQGLTVVQTARRRGVSVETVKSQRKWVLRKLGARNVTQAVHLFGAERVAAVPGAGPLSPGQLRAFHAKAGAVDDWQKRERGESKKLALAAASSQFERAILSANDLDEFEASWVLDHLEAELRSPA